MDKDLRRGVHGSIRKTDGIIALGDKKVAELEVRALEAVCSACGKSHAYRNKTNKFVPPECPSCGRSIVNIYASEQTGALTAWCE